MIDDSIVLEQASKLQDVSILTDILASASTSKQTLDALSKPSAGSYLSDLTSLSLPELQAEPAGLQTQSHHLTSSLTSLTHTSYPTFLSLHQNTTALTESLTSISSALDTLLTKSLPALEGSAVVWKDRTETILKERNKARLVLEQHEKIRDLLEIPMLIDTCVRNGYFAEALSLASHATSFALRSDEKTRPVILSSVLAELHSSVMQMLLTLLTTLYEPNRKLPALWKAVNFLRKMDAFGPSSPFAPPPPPRPIRVPFTQEDEGEDDDYGVSNEEQLALAFLVGRESCLKSMLEPIGRDINRLHTVAQLDDREKDELARYLKRYIDVWREGVYDIISQYTTIFLERQSTSSSQQSPIKLKSSPMQPSVELADLDVGRLHTLLTTYANQALSTHLLPVLTSSLSLLSLSLLPSLLTQLTYCSTAFARVGLDFRGMLAGLFETALSAVVTREMKDIADKWVTRVKKASVVDGKNANLMNGSSKNVHEMPSRWLINSSLISSPPLPASSLDTTDSGPANIPPPILVSYPPIAELTNGLLGVLNGLRLLAPVRILPQLLGFLEDKVLVTSGEVLRDYIKMVHNATFGHIEEEIEKRERERKVARASGEIYFRSFVPYLRRALVEGVFGTKIDAENEREGEKKLIRLVNEWKEWVREVEDD